MVITPCKMISEDVPEQIDLRCDNTPIADVSDIISNSNELNNAPNSDVSFEDKEIASWNGYTKNRLEMGLEKEKVGKKAITKIMKHLMTKILYYTIKIIHQSNPIHHMK